MLTPVASTWAFCEQLEDGMMLVMVFGHRVFNDVADADPLPIKKGVGESSGVHSGRSWPGGAPQGDGRERLVQGRDELVQLESFLLPFACRAFRGSHSRPLTSSPPKPSNPKPLTPNPKLTQNPTIALRTLNLKRDLDPNPNIHLNPRQQIM